jgi:hypothetical protein
MLSFCPTLKVEHLNLAKGVNIIKGDTIAYLVIVYSNKKPSILFYIVMLSFILKFCQKMSFSKFFKSFYKSFYYLKN